MNAILAILAIVLDPTLAVVTEGVSAAKGSGTEGIANGIRDFVGPLVLLAVGGAALTFLFKQQLTQFFQFAVIALLVAAFFYAPDFVKNLGTQIAGLFGG